MTICVIPTTKERGSAQRSAFHAANRLEERLNPDLINCGKLPECRNCNIRFGGEVLEVAKRVKPRVTSRLELEILDHATGKEKIQQAGKRVKRENLSCVEESLGI